MKFRIFALVALVSSMVIPASADTRVDTWVAKARSAIGSETALNNVRSIHFEGVLETTQRVPVEGQPDQVVEQPLRLGIDIVFQKPYQQRMILRTESLIETTALDGYDAWMRRARVASQTDWQLSILDAAQVKRLRANTWENLNFYRGIDRRGGTVEFAGKADVDGRSCVKLIFSHDANIVFTRYFDESTGRLVKTETENGGEIREEGDIVVEGVRFPRKLINKAPSGQVSVITFERVTLNQSFPASDFEVPMLMPR